MNTPYMHVCVDEKIAGVKRDVKTFKKIFFTAAQAPYS